jgi:2,3-bisphosphoglycerate-dependent phosphoglycerate mutase
MLHKIPQSESLKCTLQRSSVYWDKVLAPALESGKTLLVVGHENNLRSLIMRLEGIPPSEIINLNLPRAIPLAYRLDANLQPVNLRADGSFDSATGFLRGEWLGGDQAVSELLQRDDKQVYDTTIRSNLEPNAHSEKWLDMLKQDAFLPEAKVKGNEHVGSFLGTTVLSSSIDEPCFMDTPRRVAA